MIDHPDKFAEPNARAFLIEYLDALAERDQLRIFELEIGGKIVASRLTFLLGNDLYFYFAGYDTSWRNYSVMTVLVSEIIKWAIAQGLKRVNLSTGKDQSKLRWKPLEIISHDALQISPSIRGHMVFPVFRAYEALSNRRLNRYLKNQLILSSSRNAKISTIGQTPNRKLSVCKSIEPLTEERLNMSALITSRNGDLNDS